MKISRIHVATFLLSSAMGLAILSYGADGSDVSISANVLGSSLIIRSSARMAGAIDSLTWQGKEFINSDDHGRELQSASSFDGLGECYNPTEAGSSNDGNGNRSTSKLLGIRASSNVLETTTQMAFWLRPGQSYPNGCGGNPNIKVAQNSTELSNDTLSKRVTIGYSGLESVIEYLVTFHVQAAHSTATFETLTGYMPTEFNSFWTYEPKSRALSALDAGPGEQRLPLIFSTQDHRYAMGIYSPDLPQPDPEYASAGYGRFSFPSGHSTKWNTVSRKRGISPGDYSFRSYVIVGSLDQVMQAMSALDQSFFPSHPAPNPIPTQTTTPGPARQNVYRFLNRSAGEHFLTLDYSEGVRAGYASEGVAFLVLASPDPRTGNDPLYRCISGGKHFVSNSASCEGGTQEGLYGYAYSSSLPGTKPIYRLYNPSSGDHLTSTDWTEGSQAGYRLEGIQGYVPSSL